MPSSDPTISSAPSTRYAPSSSPSISLAPSTLPSASPSNMPSESPFCPPPGEDPNAWVDCVNGKVRGTDINCKYACGDDCCVGFYSCGLTNACIKKDGSCSSTGILRNGYSCYYAGYDSSYELLISGPSCVGYNACYDIFYRNQNGMEVISVTNSCTCHDACNGFHCSFDDPAPLPGLPACGDSVINVGGQSSSSCAVSSFSFSLPTFCSNATNNLITTSASLLFSISRAAKRISIV